MSVVTNMELEVIPLTGQIRRVNRIYEGDRIRLRASVTGKTRSYPAGATGTVDMYLDSKTYLLHMDEDDSMIVVSTDNGGTDLMERIDG